MELDNYLITLIETTITSTLLQKRLKNELKYINLDVFTICIESNNDDIKIIIKDKKYATSNNYIFIFAKDYPFTRPIIKINSQSYANFLQISSKKTLQTLKSLKGYDCLCCNSYVCSKWTPTTKIVDIVKEIREHREIRKNILYKLLCDKISHKYLNNDIQLEEWIY